MNITQKCSNCGKIYFIISQEEPCPFCGKNPKDGLQMFNKLFGEDNPFKDVGIT
jgi:hypothetical protein